MFENFKTDVIYYNTPTDFEMEFNLCGCCRMRLLNDKCTDKKTFLLSLSRAVSRSRVIIITAPLFSGDNITKTIASAIGSTTEVIDNAAHNINSDTEIQVIKDSLPLVTADGVFGGCLIQCGPQTMILLTDNKAVRKTVMQNLIHPYIKDIAAGKIEEPEEPEEYEENNEYALFDENEVITDADIDAEEVLPETEDELVDQIITEEETTDESDHEYEEDNELVIDEEKEPEEQGGEYFVSSYKDLYTETKPDSQDGDDDNYDYADDDYYTDIPAEKPSAFNVWFLIISVILLITVAILCYCIFVVPTKAGIEPAVYLKEIFDTMFA